MNLHLFRKHSLSSLAKELEISPFDLVRYLGFNGGLKSDLSFAKDYGAKLYQDMELESWWDSAGEMAAIIQSYRETSNIHQRRFQQLCAMLLKKSGCSRLDNLSRGFSLSLSKDELEIEKNRITIIILFLSNQNIVQIRHTSLGCAVDIIREDVLEKVASGNIEGFETFISMFDTQ